MKVTNNPNGQYKTYDVARRMIKSSGYKLYHNKLFLFDKFNSVGGDRVEMKRQRKIDLATNKTLKDRVKIL